MRNVLWITGVFPPINCGIGRQYKLAKYLPQHGWNPIVLAFDKSSFRTQMDYDLLNGLRHIRVYRTPSGESRTRQIWLPRLLMTNPRRFNSPDPWYRWRKHALEWGRWIMGDHRIEALFSTALPYTCHLVGLELKREFGLPWVADFRDLWTQSNYENWPRGVLERERRMEREVVAEADALTFISKGNMEEFLKRYPEQAGKMRHIPHGYDTEDFKGLVRQEYDDWCTFTYAGTLYGERTRGAMAFLTALYAVQRVHPELKVRVVFIGKCNALRKEVKELGLDDRVTFIPWLSKRAVLERLAMSNVLLFVLGEGKTDEQATTGKLLEYMAIGRPVMGICPEGQATRIIRETGIGTVVKSGDAIGMVKEIVRWVSEREHTPNAEAVKRYDVRLRAREMAEVLDGVC